MSHSLIDIMMNLYFFFKLRFRGGEREYIYIAISGSSSLDLFQFAIVCTFRAPKIPRVIFVKNYLTYNRFFVITKASFLYMSKLFCHEAHTSHQTNREFDNKQFLKIKNLQLLNCPGVNIIKLPYPFVFCVKILFCERFPSSLVSSKQVVHMMNDLTAEYSGLPNL